MWTPVELDDIPGRVRAVSAPDARQVLAVWTTDGLFGVWYARAATVLRMAGPGHAEPAFDAAAGVLRWQPLGADFRMHGACGWQNTPCGGDLPRATPTGDRLEFDAAGRPVGVVDADGARRLTLDDPPRAGRWFAAGFSADGRYLLVADEWAVRLFRYTPARGAEPARWKRSGAAAEQAALVRAIDAAPDDDTPRLVYADWLDEHGDPARGELIRLQCRLAHDLRAGDTPRALGRVGDLLHAHGDRWQAELPVVRGVKWAGFWRGFPAAAAGAGTLARAAAKVWAAAPVESVVLERVDAAGVAALAACPLLPRVRVLEVRGLALRTGREPFDLFAAPGLAGVWWLAVHPSGRWRGALGSAVAEAVAASPAMRSLERLSLRNCDIGEVGAEALLASPHLHSLRDLELIGNPLPDALPPRLRKRFPGVVF